MIHYVPQCLHRPVVEVGPGHENISQAWRLERRDITLLSRHEEAPEDRHLARDRCNVDSLETSLRQLALCLLRQGGRRDDLANALAAQAGGYIGSGVPAHPRRDLHTRALPGISQVLN